jgi:methyl-accepting chemotaxis protein
MIEKNNELLGNINAAAEQVAAGAKQISDSSVQLSQGSTEQASTVQQLTSSLEEVSTQTKQNAKNANEANTLAEAVRDNAQQGSGQMSDMLKAMEEINNSSSDISRIIKVIDEIAFQTNILALNAAVEAARAGQHGKGFAVVAEEVRNLAARSANAAKETTELIEGSIKRTENGTRIAKETSESLNKIVEGVEKAAALVNNIDIASNEQAAAIEQINQGIIQVSQVIQANSATSEESAAASEELSTQAELLRDSVHKFKLKDITTSSRNRYNEISPEIIKMIKDATENKNQSDVNNTKEENSIDTLSLNWDYKK